MGTFSTPQKRTGKEGEGREGERGEGGFGRKVNLVDVANVDLHAGVVLGGDQRISGGAREGGRKRTKKKKKGKK